MSGDPVIDELLTVATKALPYVVPEDSWVALKMMCRYLEAIGATIVLMTGGVDGNTYYLQAKDGRHFSYTPKVKWRRGGYLTNGEEMDGAYPVSNGYELEEVRPVYEQVIDKFIPISI